MAKIYADLCEAKLRTVKGEEGIIAVPDLWKARTIQELIDRGRYDLVPEDYQE